jgi:hypothetical protein
MKSAGDSSRGTMADKSDKHGPRLDEEMKHETEGLVRGGGPTHAEEFKDPEPVGTDTGRDPTSPGTARPGAAPAVMTPRDIEDRSAMAQVLSGVDYPATPRTLATHALRVGAPEVAVTALEQLPERSYASFADVAEYLQFGHEERRF